MYIGYQGDKACFIAKTKKELENISCVELRIEETKSPVKIIDGQIFLGKEDITNELARQVRLKRDALLKGVIDPVCCNTLRWNDLTDEAKEVFVSYRRYLLDITENEKFPCDKRYNELKIMTLGEWKEQQK